MKIVAVTGLEPATYKHTLSLLPSELHGNIKSPHDESRGHVLYLLLIKFT